MIVIPIYGIWESIYSAGATPVKRLHWKQRGPSSKRKCRWWSVVISTTAGRFRHGLSLDEVRITDKKLPFILAPAMTKDDYEQEAMRRGATLCMDKMKGPLPQDKLVEYAYRQLSGEKALLTFTSCLCPCGRYQCRSAAGGYAAKGLWPDSGFLDWGGQGRILRIRKLNWSCAIWTAGRATAMELFHTLRRVAGCSKWRIPCPASAVLILTENNDLATEYEYRHEGVNDYITAPGQYPGADPAGSCSLWNEIIIHIKICLYVFVGIGRDRTGFLWEKLVGPVNLLSRDPNFAIMNFP